MDRAPDQVKPAALIDELHRLACELAISRRCLPMVVSWLDCTLLSRPNLIEKRELEEVNTPPLPVIGRTVTVPTPQQLTSWPPSDRTESATSHRVY